MYPRLTLPRKPAEDPLDGQSVRARGGEAVLLFIPEICKALGAVCHVSMTTGRANWWSISNARPPECNMS